MAIRKKAPPKGRNIAARALASPLHRQRVIKNRRKYDRKRRDAAGLAPFGLQALLRLARCFSSSQRALPGPNCSTAKSTKARTLAERCCA